MSLITQSFDDKDLDDEALWAVIDSAAAASAASATRSLTPLPLHNRPSPKFTLPSSLTPSPTFQNPKNRRFMADGEVLQEESPGHQRPQKMARFSLSEISPPPPPPLVMVKHVQRTPTSTPSSHRSRSPVNSSSDCSLMTHSLSGRFPSVALFKEYQNAAMSILEKSDYTMISGQPFIKKSGWRKISFYFNVSFEIKDKSIEFDENRNVQRAEFVVRAHMQGGRFSDGWGSCERREKRFIKPNHDIPSTAETRAKNKACQDLLGIGEYRPGLNTQR